MNQEPTLRVCPEYSETYGNLAYDFGKSFGITLDAWQKLVMDDWLAIDRNHKWVSSTCGLSVPRQNGKTALVKVRVMLGIFWLGETILFTCHEVRTSRQVFESLADLLNPNGEYPDVASQVEYIKRSNGYEEIKVADWRDEDGNWQKGGKLLFSSRSKGASRGFTADVVVADEAMYMTDEQVAALVPTMASASGGDMQFIMLGTPPAPGDNGTVFKNTREAAMNGEKGVSWCEWGADEIGDIHDWSRIERFNPSLGTRLMRKAVESELSVMSPDTFARERLGWWSKVSNEYETCIEVEDWDACKVDNPSKDGLVVYAVKFSPDGSRGTLAACHKPDDGLPFVYVVESRSMAGGLSWFVDNLTQRKGKAAQIVIDGQGNAQTLNDRLLENGVSSKTIIRPSTGDAIAAYASLANAVNERQVTHYGQPGLNDSATKTKKRRIGTRGGWGFESTDEADATLIEAASLAYWSAMTTKRKPGRKAVVF